MLAAEISAHHSEVHQNLRVQERMFGRWTSEGIVEVTSLAEMLRNAVQKGEFARHGAKHAVSSSPLLLSNDIWCRLYHQCLDENLRDMVSM
eukprot:4098396-Prymnesium_polylepis.1